MSQFFINSANNPPPPAVPTSFVTDDGTAIPAANILNVNGIDSIENNSNGILTRSNPNLSNNLQIIVTNRIQGTVSTSGAVTSAIVTFTPTVIGTYSIEARVSAYNTTSTLGAGYSIFGAVRFDGVNSNLCGTPDKIINEEGTMSNANCTLTVSGANILINGVGYAAQTINWSVVGLYTFIGA
jgi:hypothetical protein